MSSPPKQDARPEDVFKIRIHHIGGIGNYGYVEGLSVLGDVEWIVYDALEDSLSATRSPGGEFVLVPKCIGGADLSNVEFFVTQASSASSLLRQSGAAESYTLVLPDGRIQVWGHHAKTRKTMTLDLSALQSLIDSGQVPPIDFLSIDAQGAELPILKGAMPTLGKETLGVLCEVEFAELYDKQPLFSDTEAFLRGLGFRVCEIYYKQYMNTTPLPPSLEGRGFLTAGEALFLRNASSLEASPGRGPPDDPSLPAIRLLKLAAVALVFDQLDYSISLCNTLKTDFGVDLDALSKRAPIKYVSLLRDVMLAAEEVQGRKKAVPEREESEPAEAVHRWSITLGLVGVLLKAAVQGLSRRAVSAVLRRQSVLGLPPVSRVLYRYGLRELAIRQMMRDSNIPYWTRGNGTDYLAYVVSILFRLG